jgi:hypothetical protein
MVKRDKRPRGTQPALSGAGGRRKAARAARLASRLRDNLSRRKVQRRAREREASAEDDKPET